MASRRRKIDPAKVAAQIAKLEAEQANEPCRVYRPGPTCDRCARSSAYFRLVNGGNQVGKTNHAIWETACMARGIHPHKPTYGPVKLLVVVPSRQQATMVWGHRLLTRCEMPGEIGQHPFIPEREVKKVWYNYSGTGKAPGAIELTNGSTIMFAWSGDVRMWERVQGMMFDYIVRDEAVGNERLPGELMMRLVKVRSCTPWGGGILWVGTPTLDSDEYEEFARKCRSGVEHYEEFFIHPSENPAVSMTVRESLRESMDEDEAAMRLDGTQGAGVPLRIYRRQWKDERHVAAADYEPTEFDNLWIAFDPGIGHPAGVLCAAINRDQPETLRLVRFSCVRGQPLSYHLDDMASWLDGRTLEGLVVDPKAFTRESTGKSIVTQIEEALSVPMPPFRISRGIIPGRNNHWDTINKVMEWLDPTPGNEHTPTRIVCNPSSPGMGLFVWQMKNYKGREETKYTGIHGVVKKKDEGPDCLRYLVSVEPTFEPRAPNPRRGRPGTLLTPEQLEAAELARLPPDLRRHREHLARSAQRMAEMQREELGTDGWIDAPGRLLATTRLDW